MQNEVTLKPRTEFRQICAIIWLMLLHLTAVAQSGIYQNLLIGVDGRTGVMTGAYSETRNPPDGPSFSCIFAIRGRLHKGAITAGFPGLAGISGGVLNFGQEASVKTAFLKLEEQQLGCMQASPMDFLGGEKLDMSQAKSWQAVLIVTAKRAYFHNSPNSQDRRRSYLVYGDCVGVIEIRENWAKVEYIRGNGSTI
jgi:hypothetical protein